MLMWQSNLDIKMIQNHILTQLEFSWSNKVHWNCFQITFIRDVYNLLIYVPAFIALWIKIHSKYEESLKLFSHIRVLVRFHESYSITKFLIVYLFCNLSRLLANLFNFAKFLNASRSGHTRPASLQNDAMHVFC